MEDTSGDLVGERTWKEDWPLRVITGFQNWIEYLKS